MVTFLFGQILPEGTSSKGFACSHGRRTVGVTGTHGDPRGPTWGRGGATGTHLGSHLGSLKYTQSKATPADTWEINLKSSQVSFQVETLLWYAAQAEGRAVPEEGA